MIVLYAESDEERNRVQAALPNVRLVAPARVVTAARAREIETGQPPGRKRRRPTDPTPEEQRALGRASCIIFAYAAERLRVWHDWVADLGQRFPEVPRVLVTHRSAEALRGVSGLSFAEIVWWDEMSTLGGAVERAAIEGVLTSFAADIPSDSLGPNGLRGLQLALRAHRPYTAEAPLAADAGCSPSTLRKEVHEAVSGALRLHHFLWAIQVCRARRQRAGGASWQRIAESLSCTRRNAPEPRACVARLYAAPVGQDRARRAPPPLPA